jgi:alkanesulfonate monooxygenase SsuD/methylene tetrahydromethanopterin reductase-like flavin-dependent oxidoreductase (luciferase family)
MSVEFLGIAAVTSKTRLFTGITLLSVLDPVRVAGDYATLGIRRT